MGKVLMSEEKKPVDQPVIRIGNKEVPTFEAWKKLEAADVAATRLEQLNARYPKLATEFGRTTIKTTRKRLKSVEVLMPKAPEKTPELEEVVADLIGSLSVEDVLETLARDHDIELDAVGLIHVIGFDSYSDMLKREAAEFQQNFLSDEQIAELWNEAHMPAPGGAARWDSDAVERLLSE